MLQKIFFISICFILGLAEVFGQGYLLIIAKLDCEVTIDGEIKETCEKDSPKKVSLTEGDHFIKANSSDGQETSAIVTVENGKQKIFQIEFKAINNEKLPKN